MDFEFAQSTEVDTLDRVPEHFRGFYAESNGKFVVNEALKAAGLAVDGLNRSLKAARIDATNARKNAPDLSPWLALGQDLEIEGDVTPEAIRDSITGLRDKVGKNDASKVNYDKLVGNLKTAHAQALQGKDGEIQSMEGTVKKYLINGDATRAIAAQKGAPELLLPVIQQQCKVIKDGDEYTVRVLDAQGEPRGDGKGGFMTVADLVTELKASPIYGRAFDSELPQGQGGKKPGSSSGQVTPPGQVKTSLDKLSAGLKKHGFVS